MLRFEVRVPLNHPKFPGLFSGLHVECNTASEARAEMKRRMGLGKKGRLPVGSRAVRLHAAAPALP